MLPGTAGVYYMVTETLERWRPGTQLASVPRDEGGLPQLERKQRGTFSAGAAPPLTRPGSLPSGAYL